MEKPPFICQNPLVFARSQFRWGISSNGRAVDSHSTGKGIDAPILQFFLHQCINGGAVDSHSFLFDRLHFIQCADRDNASQARKKTTMTPESPNTYARPVQL